ncbi:DUF6602 domain-containing protein [Agarivorans sp. DSG3-1]|uniref:DUF6602 domain-containing protein n=1 Tax=Agarivorans sp. DSG3-1 TaxID=3342249 RepID=UPI00398F58B9
MKYRREHGTRNPVIEQEEKSILLAVDRALSSSSNSQTIGRNGELPLVDFLNRYLPPTFKAVSGHFLTPKGNISPQIDVMVLDSRYPLLAENIDGSVLAMLHSVVQTIEVKTNMTSTDLKKIASDTKKIRILMNEVDSFANQESFSPPTAMVLAYRIKNKLDTVEQSFCKHSEPDKFHFDLTILRLSETDLKHQNVGCELRFEPVQAEDMPEFKEKYDVPDEYLNGNFVFGIRASYTPLSDVYYSMVQTGYYTLGARDFGFNDIGEHVMDYMSWSTARWNELYE